SLIVPIIQNVGGEHVVAFACQPRRQVSAPATVVQHAGPGDERREKTDVRVWFQLRLVMVVNGVEPERLVASSERVLEKESGSIVQPGDIDGLLLTVSQTVERLVDHRVHLE